MLVHQRPIEFTVFRGFGWFSQLGVRVAELETKRILLEAYRVQQEKSSQTAAIPTFYKKACICFIRSMFDAVLESTEC